MNPIAVLTLTIISIPCLAGLLLIRWTRQGHMVTPKALARADEIMTPYQPTPKAYKPYLFPPPLPAQQALFGWEVRPRALNHIVRGVRGFIADYRFAEEQALKNWK